MQTHDRFSGTFDRFPGRLVYQKNGASVSSIRGTSRAAIKRELGSQTGTGRPGFPHLPMEGAPREGDMWRRFQR